MIVTGEESNHVPSEIGKEIGKQFVISVCELLLTIVFAEVFKKGREKKLRKLAGLQEDKGK